MSVQIVMDRSGDTRHEFDATDQAAVDAAKVRFDTLIGRGWRAVALGKDGQPNQLQRTFDKNIEQTLFIPQLVGG